MKQYHKLLKAILDDPEANVVGTRSGETTKVFGHTSRYDLREGLPVLTNKKMYLKGIISELKWFLQGRTNIKTLIKDRCNIWNADAYRHYLSITKLAPESNPCDVLFIEDVENSRIRELTKIEFIQRITYWDMGDLLTAHDFYHLGDLGPVYGKQWRNTSNCSNPTTSDQLTKTISGIFANKYGRRHIISAWNVAEVEHMALAPCHILMQFNVGYDNDNPKIKYLDVAMYQRSADAFLGVPFNITSYALLLTIVAEMTGLVPRYFIHNIGDLHIYGNHLEAVDTYLQRTPKKLPKLLISDDLKYTASNVYTSFQTNSEKNQLQAINTLIDSIKIEDFKLEGYTPDPKIKAKLSVG